MAKVLLLGVAHFQPPGIAMTLNDRDVDAILSLPLDNLACGSQVDDLMSFPGPGHHRCTHPLWT